MHKTTPNLPKLRVGSFRKTPNSLQTPESFSKNDQWREEPVGVLNPVTENLVFLCPHYLTPLLLKKFSKEGEKGQATQRASTKFEAHELCLQSIISVSSCQEFQTSITSLYTKPAHVSASMSPSRHVRQSAQRIFVRRQKSLIGDVAASQYPFSVREPILNSPPHCSNFSAFDSHRDNDRQRIEETRNSVSRIASPIHSPVVVSQIDDKP